MNATDLSKSRAGVDRSPGPRPHAIIVGVMLGKLAQRRQGSPFNAVMRLALHEALLGRSVFRLKRLLA